MAALLIYNELFKLEFLKIFSLNFNFLYVHSNGIYICIFHNLIDVYNNF